MKRLMKIRPLRELMTGHYAPMPPWKCESIYEPNTWREVLQNIWRVWRWNFQSEITVTKEYQEMLRELDLKSPLPHPLRSVGHLPMPGLSSNQLRHTALGHAILQNRERQGRRAHQEFLRAADAARNQTP